MSQDNYKEHVNQFREGMVFNSDIFQDLIAMNLNLGVEVFGLLMIFASGPQITYVHS